jgi:hypothetical protein
MFIISKQKRTTVNNVTVISAIKSQEKSALQYGIWVGLGNSELFEIASYDSGAKAMAVYEQLQNAMIADEKFFILPGNEEVQV